MSSESEAAAAKCYDDDYNHDYDNFFPTPEPTSELKPKRGATSKHHNQEILHLRPTSYPTKGSKDSSEQ